MSLGLQSDPQFMARALELAQRAWGQTHPNPMVGAVIVEDGEIVATGWHQRAGQAHAEVAALRALGRAPQKGASLYVTLEPCSTCGRTGACTTALIESGIQRVVVGAVDPNPAHAGQGLALLRAAGIQVVEGILAEDCSDLNLIFNHWIVQQTPFLAAKIALTLDGKFSAASGHSKWVTGELARADVMRWRRYFPAIAVSAATVLADNPSLTSRIAGEETWCPTRFVFDRTLRTVATTPWPQVYTDAYKNRTLTLCAESAPQELQQRLSDAGLQVWTLPLTTEGHLDLVVFKQRCAQAEIYGVYIETGPAWATGLIEQRGVDYLFIYQAPKFMSDACAPGIGTPRNTGSMQAAIELTQIKQLPLGSDILIRGKL
ncbi:MAG: diaminohydroxyphosphoribosylaminopyrimidine deaminase [Lentimonas sp.]|jgi:diaminohydroxyphosphoribosylaminopyrimidine deaminase/5-amino-6-(5-phosphoribosylamino)uracil reductase